MDTNALIQQLEKIIADPSVVDEGSRQRVKQLARQASAAVEQPFETVRRLVFTVSQIRQVLLRKVLMGFSPFC